MTIESVIIAAQARWPGLHLKRKTADEAAGACPFCGQGEDRFRVFDGNGTSGPRYWCRQCDAKGFLDEDDAAPDWERQVERRLAALERAKAEHARRLSALERMASLWPTVTEYLEACLQSDQALEYWHGEGITRDSIEQYALGYCERCPTDAEGHSSFTIPCTDRGTLLNIRHRLIGDSVNGGRYRPHLAGLGQQLFNVDELDAGHPSVLVVEGEKKAVVCGQEGFPSVAVQGKRGRFKRDWFERAKGIPRVYVALDPDATDSAFRLARHFGRRGRVVLLPVKADDFFTRYGGTAGEFRRFLEDARTAEGGK